MFAPPPGNHICFLYFCAGCSTAFVLMELVSFLDPSLLLMFLLLVSSVFAVSLTILFLLGVLHNIAVRWISPTEYLSNKLSNVFYRWLLLEFITTVFSFSELPFNKKLISCLFLWGSVSQGFVSSAFNSCLVSSCSAWLSHPPQNYCCLRCSCKWCSTNLRQV